MKFSTWPIETIVPCSKTADDVAVRLVVTPAFSTSGSLIVFPQSGHVSPTSLHHSGASALPKYYSVVSKTCFSRGVFGSCQLATLYRNLIRF